MDSEKVEIGSQPTRIQRQRTKGWKMPPGAVYVGRPSKWGNPAVIDFALATVDINNVLHCCDTVEECRECAAEQYRIWLLSHADGMPVADAAKRELRGKTLACWCPLDQPCHADVLLKIANS